MDRDEDREHVVLIEVTYAQSALWRRLDHIGVKARGCGADAGAAA